ncbi:SpoIIE family protein phosphatase [Kitasatospora sp. NPDC006697]|uniref:SpoIIE family protein phosphatase n=1 Tax=Kitasatospora sp. NPDC006697 TaxID=3364020 RepID=UPI0036BBCB21
MWMAWGPELTFFCNDAYRRDTLGHKYPWALGRPFREVWAEVWEDVRPRVTSVLEEGRATWDEGLMLLLQRSGYVEESYHTFSYSPLRDEAGRVAGVLCVVSEETQRVISERRMGTLRDLGSAPDAVRTERQFLGFSAEQLSRNPFCLPFTLTYLFEEDGTARLASSSGFTDPQAAAARRWPEEAAEAAGRGRASLVELTGEPFAGLPSGAWHEPPRQALVVPLGVAGARPTGFLVAGLNRFRALDDGYRGFVDLVAGHLASGVASARSYELERRRARELAELDRAKTAFFYNISHEFRTPLTLIVGPVEELRRQLADADEAVRADLETVHRNGLRLGRLVNSLLDFSQIEAGRMRARLEPADLAAVTADLAAAFRSAVERAGLELEVDCPPLPAPVLIDRGLWEKVVFNLLGNALKYTFDGAIRVRVQAAGGRARVEVEDTGVGIPAAELPHLFERFHRVENTRARSHEGSGIGLALVKEVVELHGGTIAAASEPGRGSRFTVSLPLAPAPAPNGGSPAHRDTEDGRLSGRAEPFLQEALRWLPDGSAAEARSESSAEPASAGNGPVPAQVLVADDNADMRDYLDRLLRGAGYRVTLAADGLEALASARRDVPELVISDVMMPGLDGLHLVAGLRADPRTATVPVLLLSARAGQEASVEGLGSGADDYLTKPFATTDLLARVRSAVELSRLRDHHSRWRAALVDSLQDAFFVCDEDGGLVETNAAFTALLGTGAQDAPGPDGTPGPGQPGTPVDAGLRRRAATVARRALDGGGRTTVPMRAADGRRLWVQVAANRVQDPATGRTVIVGTMRDVTAEHYSARREQALATLNDRLTRAPDTAGALTRAVEQLRDLWRARRVLAARFVRGDLTAPPAELLAVSGTPGRPVPDWSDLPRFERERLSALRRAPVLTPTPFPGGAGILLDHPDGPLALTLDLGDPGGPGGRRPFGPEDGTLLALLADRLAQGLTRAHRIDRDRETAIALQRAILGPADLPDRFAARYEPASRPLEVGGDWYDTMALPGGRIGIVVGDCVGHGLEAASVMGQLRSACRALLLQDHDPARALAALDTFAATIPGALCATVFCAVLHTATGELRYSSAGHPPGILARPDGTTALLEGGRSLPLAVGPGLPRPGATATLPPGAVLLLYTDGLVERRGSTLTEGIERAAEVLRADADLPLDQLADHLTTRLSAAGGYGDDVALLLYRHRGLPRDGAGRAG